LTHVNAGFRARQYPHSLAGGRCGCPPTKQVNASSPAKGLKMRDSRSEWK